MTLTLRQEIEEKFEEELGFITKKLDEMAGMENDGLHKRFRNFIFSTVIPMVMEQLPKLENHICRFNDGDCKCDCFIEFQQTFLSNLKREDIIK